MRHTGQNAPVNSAAYHFSMVDCLRDLLSSRDVQRASSAMKLWGTRSVSCCLDIASPLARTERRGQKQRSIRKCLARLSSRLCRLPTERRAARFTPVSYTHLRAHETPEHLV